MPSINYSPLIVFNTFTTGEFGKDTKQIILRLKGIASGVCGLEKYFKKVAHNDKDIVITECASVNNSINTSEEGTALRRNERTRLVPERYGKLLSN